MHTKSIQSQKKVKVPAMKACFIFLPIFLLSFYISWGQKLSKTIVNGCYTISPTGTNFSLNPKPGYPPVAAGDTLIQGQDSWEWTFTTAGTDTFYIQSGVPQPTQA